MISRIFIGAAAFAASVSFAAAENAGPIVSGKWRITRMVVAPWTDDAGAGVKPQWIGATVAFGAKAVKGPHPIGCGHAKFEATDAPPEGLFQGGLPEPASTTMIPLGLAGMSFKGVSVSCDKGVFDYHYADDDTLLLALDNRILTLDRTIGAHASKTSPEGVVQRFLEAHFDGDMGFAAPLAAGKRVLLSKSLAEKIDAWFAVPQNPDEAPAINGDPFTDTQEYPARFAVGAGERTAEGLFVPAEFADAFSKRSVRFVLKREKGRWLIDDLKYEDGSMLYAMLAR